MHIYNKIDINSLVKLIKEKIDEYYTSILLKTLKSVIYEIDFGYTAYDLNNNIINNIDELINIKLNNIKNIIESTKGTYFDINLNNWENIIDFTLDYIIIND